MQDEAETVERQQDVTIGRGVDCCYNAGCRLSSRRQKEKEEDGAAGGLGGSARREMTELVSLPLRTEFSDAYQRRSTLSMSAQMKKMMRKPD